MKSKILFVVFTLSFFSAYSQDYNGRIIYKQTRSAKSFKQMGNVDPIDSVTFKEKIKKSIKQFDKFFILTFTKSTSLYKEDKTLIHPNVNGNRIAIMANNNAIGNLYVNIKRKKYINQVELLGKRFLIKDKLTKIDWKLKNMSKKIGSYMCYKATTEVISSIPKDITDLSKGYSKITDTITAWYTTEIPISHGPQKYHGLPGLILELNLAGNINIRAEELTINTLKKIKISEPKKGSVITQKKFDKISKEKIQEMISRF